MNLRVKVVPWALVAMLATAVAAAEPKTPLGKWMKTNLGAPLAGEDFAALRTGLEVVAKNPPAGRYGEWVSIADAGALAASKQDRAGTKESCKQCHDLYKQKYIAEYPGRPFP